MKFGAEIIKHSFSQVRKSLFDEKLKQTWLNLANAVRVRPVVTRLTVLHWLKICSKLKELHMN